MEINQNLVWPPKIGELHEYKSLTGRNVFYLVLEVGPEIGPENNFPAREMKIFLLDLKEIRSCISYKKFYENNVVRKII